MLSSTFKWDFHCNLSAIFPRSTFTIGSILNFKKKVLLFFKKKMLSSTFEWDFQCKRLLQGVLWILLRPQQRVLWILLRPQQRVLLIWAKLVHLWSKRVFLFWATIQCIHIRPVQRVLLIQVYSSLYGGTLGREHTENTLIRRGVVQVYSSLYGRTSRASTFI